MMAEVAFVLGWKDIGGLTDKIEYERQVSIILMLSLLNLRTVVCMCKYILLIRKYTKKYVGGDGGERDSANG